ncbi:MAG: AlpA family phage regulatory protein [Chlorobium sp.]|nr:AlpA family phage regulatory protein [Chlorobium sp.]
MGQSTFHTNFLPLDKVEQKTNLSKSTIRRMEIAGNFPRRHRISPRRIVWLAADIEAWIQEKVGANTR